MSSDSDPSPSANSPSLRPEELPPVTPPSAGYIVQLFLIPALIVMAVVAVWALFGKLADSESDWKQLVVELGSSNEHRRWRAAIGLAQLMKNEELSPPADREPLSKHPQVVDALVGLLNESLSSTAPTSEDITHQEFLVRTMGALNADEQTLPVVVKAMGDTHDIEVRKSALMSAAVIAGRHFDRQTGYAEKSTGLVQKRNVPLTSAVVADPVLMTELKRTAQSPEPVLRHLAAFAIGNVGGPEAVEVLKVMLSDGDRFARANAALSLARNGIPEAFGPVRELIEEALQPMDAARLQGKSAEKQRIARLAFEVEEPKVVRNCLHAIGDLWSQLDATQKSDARALMQRVQADFFAADVRIQAANLLKATVSPQTLQ